MKSSDEKKSKKEQKHQQSGSAPDEATQKIISDIVAYCREGNKWRVSAILSRVAADERGALLNQYDRFGDTALTVAASGGYDGLVHYLLSIPGIDPNVRTKGTGFTPLTIAAAKGNAQIVDRLIHLSSINPGIKDANDLTAAQEAAYSGHVDISEMITNRRV